MMDQRTLLLLAALAVAAVHSIPIENGVEGEPEIECGATAITVNFNTQKSFQGHVYVKGRFNEADCRNDQVGRSVAGITLPFTTCGVSRLRSANPRGVFVSTIVIISFHPKFTTKVDRAYRVQCFYMEADKTVSAELEVSMLTTGFQTQVVPMPVCRYEILAGGPTGKPITYALVGEQVYHKWTCDTETVDTFCMLVTLCFVDDGQGDNVDLIDPNGCAVDKFLLNNLEYPTDLMAGQEAHVFKYADRAQLYFQCQITISVKEPNQQCARPNCPELVRGKREVYSPSDSIIDVSFGPLAALDGTLNQPVIDSSVIAESDKSASICVSLTGTVILLGAALFVLSVSFVVIGLSSKRSGVKHN